MSDLVERYRRQIEVALKYANDEKPAHDRILPSVFELQVGHLRDIGNELTAELSRLSALVAEWQKAAEPLLAQWDAYKASTINQQDAYYCLAKGQWDKWDRLSQLKDTTNADK